MSEHISPFDTDGTLSSDAGDLKSINGAVIEPFREEDVLETLYYGSSGDGWEGQESVVVKLSGGRVAAWETWWGPTGNGFWEDA